jgi:hypothetical protein
MTSTTQKQNPLAAVGGIAGAAGGFALSKYSGASLLIPGVAAILILMVFTKTSVRPRFFRGAISIVTAHIVWFIAAALLLGMWAPVILDIIVLTIGVAWLWVRPGIGPVIFVAVVELISLVINIVTITSAEVGSPAHRALVVHLLLRVAALVCLALGYRRLRAERDASNSAVLTPTANA